MENKKQDKKGSKKNRRIEALAIIIIVILSINTIFLVFTAYRIDTIMDQGVTEMDNKTTQIQKAIGTLITNYITLGKNMMNQTIDDFMDGEIKIVEKHDRNININETYETGNLKISFTYHGYDIILGENIFSYIANNTTKTLEYGKLQITDTDLDEWTYRFVPLDSFNMYSQGRAWIGNWIVTYVLLEKNKMRLHIEEQKIIEFQIDT